jgi:hypothetical protein
MMTDKDMLAIAGLIAMFCGVAGIGVLFTAMTVVLRGKGGKRNARRK